MTHPQTPVKLVDLQFETRAIQGQFIEKTLKILEKGDFVLGGEVSAFENECKKLFQCADAVACASGSDALLLALMALETNPGDILLTTSFSFFATAGSIVRLGAIPVYLDIDPETWNLSPFEVSSFLEKECEMKSGKCIHKSSERVVKGIIPVHLYGFPSDIFAFQKIAKKWGLFIIEDNAQAFSGHVKDEKGDLSRCGSIGEAGCLSFYPTKNLGALGDAGMVLAKTEEIGKKIRILRNHGMEPRYYHHFLGMNSRMDSFQAAALNCKLAFLPDWDRAREKNGSLYHHYLGDFSKKFPNRLKLPVSPDFSGNHCYHQFVIEVEGRDSIQELLKSRGIESAIFYPLLLNEQPCLKELNPIKTQCPHAEKAAKRVLALPVGPSLTCDQIKWVSETVLEGLK